MAECYDCIVLGVGGFGSGTFYYLAKRGANVLGLEQFGVAHDRGSSHGETRIIRQAYFEHPAYVPLARKAYDAWRTLEAETGESLMHLAGVLLAGPEEGEAVGGAKLSANRHQLRLEDVSPRDAHTRFPGLLFDDDQSVVYEPDAGYLHVEQCVAAHIEEAIHLGGTLKTGERVLDWKSHGKHVEVTTERNRYHAERLVITAGPWSSQILNELSLPLRILRKPVFWFAASPAHRQTAARLPAFLYELPEGVFYGLPGADAKSVKLAEHSGGRPVSNPEKVEREIDSDDEAKVEGFRQQYVPAANSKTQRHSVCFYTMTADGHFVIDHHPRFENVVFGAGFSGHGFKFTGILGRALGDLALDGKTDLPIEFLSLNRKSLQTRESP